MASKMIKRSSMCILVVMVILVSAFSVSAASYAPPAAPVINNFSASSTNITAGDTVKLSWNVTGAEEIEILGYGKTREGLPQNGELEFWPLETTTYILNAYGPGYTMTSKSITVVVDSQENVKIVYFKADKTEVSPYDTVKLSFKVLNAVDYEIRGLSKLPECMPVLEDSIEVFPGETTSYLLTAYGKNGGAASAVVTVTVKDTEPVSINSFTVSPSKINKGEKAKLSWNVSNAEFIEIEGVAKNVGAQGVMEVSPAATREYKIIATGESGDVATAKVLVEVVQPQKVEIVSFAADKTEVSRGTLVKLSWVTKNAEGCMIVTSDGLRLMNRPANGTIAITPNTTRTYTLVAYNGDQATAEKSVTITVK